MKKIYFLCVIMTTFALSSCHTTLADDGKHPTVLCTISGANFSYSWNSSMGRYSIRVANDTASIVEGSEHAINLHHNPNGTEVMITTVVVDGGGVAQAGARIRPFVASPTEPGYDVLEKPEATVVTEVAPAPTKHFYFRGNPAAPLTGIAYTMKIRIRPHAIVDVNGFGFDFQAHGFQGIPCRLIQE